MGLETEGKGADLPELMLRETTQPLRPSSYRKQADRAQVESCAQTKGIKIYLGIGCIPQIPLLRFALLDWIELNRT